MASSSYGCNRLLYFVVSTKLLPSVNSDIAPLEEREVLLEGSLERPTLAAVLAEEYFTNPEIVAPAVQTQLEPSQMQLGPLQATPLTTGHCSG